MSHLKIFHDYFATLSQSLQCKHCFSLLWREWKQTVSDKIKLLSLKTRQVWLVLSHNQASQPVEIYASGNAIENALKTVSAVEENFSQTLHKIIETKLHITEPGELLTEKNVFDQEIFLRPKKFLQPKHTFSEAPKHVSKSPNTFLNPKTPK